MNKLFNKALQKFDNIGKDLLIISKNKNCRVYS